jgi:hypothetical protein
MGDFTFQVGSRVGIFGEDNDDQATGIDGLPGRLCPIFARGNVPRSYPAFQAGTFKLCGNRISDAFILMGMTDENVVVHKSCFQIIEIVVDNKPGQSMSRAEGWAKSARFALIG